MTTRRQVTHLLNVKQIGKSLSTWTQEKSNPNNTYYVTICSRM